MTDCLRLRRPSRQDRPFSPRITFARRPSLRRRGRSDNDAGGSIPTPTDGFLSRLPLLDLVIVSSPRPGSLEPKPLPNDCALFDDRDLTLLLHRPRLREVEAYLPE